MVKNILMALSSVMTKTPVAYVTATEGRSSAPRCPVMESAATLTNRPDNAVENVNVRKVKLCPRSQFRFIDFKLSFVSRDYKMALYVFI